MSPHRHLVHILSKDIRGHLPEIGVVLLLNIAVTLLLTQSWAESFESTETPVAAAAQLLLVLAWCVLIGRVVLDDGLADKAPQWLTRPCSRPVLLASKLAFVLLVVHVPSFLSQLVIVTGSGVPLSLRQLLLNQAIFAATMSLPSMALAALTRNLSRFVFAGVAVAAVALLVIVATASRNPLFSAGAAPFYAGYSTFLVATELAILALISGVALIAQYRWRSTLRVAAASLVALSLLGLVMFTLPRTAIQRARAAVVQETATPTIRLRDISERRIYAARVPDIPLVVSLPIETPVTNSFSPTDEMLPRRIEVDVHSAAGDKVQLVRYGLRRSDDVNRWLDLELTQSDYASLKDSLVSVRILVEFESYEARETEPIPLDGSFTIVAGRAQCGMNSRLSLRRVYCRASFGWSIWFADPLNRPEAQQMWLPTRLRFAINPVYIVPIKSYALNNPLPGTAIATSLRQPVSYTRQDVRFENIRLGDWGP